MLKNSSSAANQALKVQTINSTILSFLEPADVPAFASINSSTKNLINLFKNSIKFQQNNSFSKTVIKLLQNEAHKILNDPEINWLEQDNQLITALTKIKNGKLDKELLRVIKTQKIKYKNNTQESFLNAAGQTLKGGLRLSGEMMKSANSKSLEGGFILILLVLFVSALISIIGAMSHGVTHCTNECRSMKKRRQLQAKLAFFKNLPDDTDEKENKAEKKINP